MVLTRSASCTFKPASGSRDSGAPAFAASRCQASASARFRRGNSSRCCARVAHSVAAASCPLLRLISSSFSFKGRAAPLSRLARSLYTSAICSAVGLPVSHWRMREARSPDVGAEKAPPVKPSKGCTWAWLVAGPFLSVPELGLLSAELDLDGLGDLERGKRSINKNGSSKNQ